MPRRRDRRLPAVVLAVLMAGALPGQTASATPSAQPAVALTTPDGSRFVLLPDPSVPQVHWSIASFHDGGDDPDDALGLARATLQVSFLGTWASSVDPVRERTALADLYREWAGFLSDPRDAKKAIRVRELTTLTEQLGDVMQFPRRWAAAPAFQPEIVEHGPIGTATLTTIAPALGDVARLVLERREQQALRRIGLAWFDSFQRRATATMSDPLRQVRAELLALTSPEHPAARLLEPPVATTITHEKALAVWATTQHPSRTVHVLHGDFDVTTASATLRAVFAATALPPPARDGRPPFRALNGNRRSTVPGLPMPCIAVGWLLPPGCDPDVLATAAAVFGGGKDSAVGKALAKAGHADATVAVDVPWPATVDGRGLFLLTITSPAPAKGLDDLVLGAARAAASAVPDEARVGAIDLERQLQWRARTPDARRLATELAVRALAWPNSPVRNYGPPPVTGKQIQELLGRVFAGHAVVVEGRP
ncbi:MAG: insulinase family protein [Planctomycetes bacterium]|nr:insulinase family protein [Planctomycetota bacterium]